MKKSYEWYFQLKKPKWAPPSWLFGPVWSVLYVLIFISFGFVFFNVAKGSLPFVLALPFILNLISNFLFTPIQFGLKNNYLAAVDIIIVLFSLIFCLFVIYPYIKWVFFVNIPYFIWVLFATVLQFTIVYLNRKNVVKDLE